MSPLKSLYDVGSFRLLLPGGNLFATGYEILDKRPEIIYNYIADTSKIDLRGGR